MGSSKNKQFSISQAAKGQLASILLLSAHTSHVITSNLIPSTIFLTTFFSTDLYLAEASIFSHFSWWIHRPLPERPNMEVQETL